MTSQRESVHFIAIGGIGMSALAKILLSMGYRVSGSDEKESDRLQELRSLEQPFILVHAAEHVPADCKEVIYSSAINMEENPEYLCAVARNIPITHRGSLLARPCQCRAGVCRCRCPWENDYIGNVVPHLV